MKEIHNYFHSFILIRQIIFDVNLSFDFNYIILFYVYWINLNSNLHFRTREASFGQIAAAEIGVNLSQLKQGKFASLIRHMINKDDS